MVEFAASLDVAIEVESGARLRLEDPRYHVDLIVYSPMSGISILEDLCGMRGLELVDAGDRLLVRDREAEEPECE